MEIVPGSIDQLSQIISQVVAPAFLLGAVASFVSILASRMNGVIERMRFVNDLPQEGHAKSRLKADLPRLRRRVVLLQRSLLFAIASGFAGAVLIVVAFGAALLQRNHVWGTALLFSLSMVMLCISLGLLAAEVRIGLNEFDQE
ncbi:DUF2721 domain-containing protein [Aestuariivirga sp.]|uniref:DUF2721 domain-containing protein n=1 Tax=Aestuariivirga sp. TaxID=2650926 RepID=UPI003BAA4F55